MATNIQKIRELSGDELTAEVRSLREQLFKLRWQATAGQIENPNKIRTVRRDIARHLTVRREQAGAAETTGAGDAK